MGKLTTHVLDLAAGVPAADMRIELHELQSGAPRRLTEQRTNQLGRSPQPLLEGAGLRVGRYQLTYHTADYFRGRGTPLPEPPFIDAVVVAFGVASPSQDYHIPLLVSPWSYSVYRGS